MVCSAALLCTAVQVAFEHLVHTKETPMWVSLWCPSGHDLLASGWWNLCFPGSPPAQAAHWGSDDNGWGWETSLLPSLPHGQLFLIFLRIMDYILQCYPMWAEKKQSQGLSATFFHPVFSSLIQQSLCIAAKGRWEAVFGCMETPCLVLLCILRVSDVEISLWFCVNRVALNSNIRK